MWKTLMYKNLKATIVSTVYDNQKQPKNVHYHNYFGSIITNDKVKIQDFHVNATFDKKKTLFANKPDQ
jgi:hypothetical protein